MIEVFSIFFIDDPDNALYGRIKQLIQKNTSNFDCKL